MNRYKFTHKTIDEAKRYLKTKKGVQPNFLKRFTGSVKKGKLFLNDLQVVPKSEVESTLRKEIYDGKVPLARDTAYYYLQKKYAGIPRKTLDDFLKKQRIIRETDNAQPTTKHKSRRVNTKGQLHVDLVEIKFKDLPNRGEDIFVPRFKLAKVSNKWDGDEEGDLKKGYFFGCVDALTSLCYYRWAPSKAHRHITPVAKEAFQYMREKLQKTKLSVTMDGGKEFDRERYKKWDIRTRVVKLDPVIEAKNSMFQRALYRIAKMKKTKNIKKLGDMAMNQLNNTVSSITKKTPLENVKESRTELAEKYNKKRGKESGTKIRARALKPGIDKVRVQIIQDKNKGINFKAYKGKTWSRKLYKVVGKRGNYYTVLYDDNGTLQKPKNQRFHRDKLRLTSAYDKASEKLLKDRD